MNSIYTLSFSSLILIGILKGGEGEPTVPPLLKSIGRSKKHRALPAEGKELAAADKLICGPKCDGSGAVDSLKLYSTLLQTYTALESSQISLIQAYLDQHIDLYLHGSMCQAANKGATTSICVSVPCSKVYSKELSRVPLSGDSFTGLFANSQAQFYNERHPTKGPAFYVNIRICDIRRALHDYAIEVNLPQEKLDVYTLTFLSATTTTPYLSLVKKPTCNTYIAYRCIEEYSQVTKKYDLFPFSPSAPFASLSLEGDSQFYVTTHSKKYVKEQLEERTKLLAKEADQEYRSRFH